MSKLEELQAQADELLIDAEGMDEAQLEAAIAEAEAADEIDELSPAEAEAKAKEEAEAKAKADKKAAADAKAKSDAKVDKAVEKKGDTMEIEILRGYTPEDKSDILPGNNKLIPGQIVEMDAKTARKLIKAEIATFPDDDEDDLGEG